MARFFMNENYMDLLKNFYSSWQRFSNNSNQLLFQYNGALAESILNAFNENKANFFSLTSDEMRKKVRKSFDKNFREKMKNENFIEIVSNTMDGWLSLSEYYGINKSYQFFVDLFASMNKVLEPLRDSLNRTESEIIPMNGRYHLLHYKPQKKISQKTPILVVYSLINRHYILDLLPEVSVVKHFIDEGFDVYATDWETPSTFDKDLTLENYIHENVENAVNKVREITGSGKVTLFGYCWGGIFSLIYSTMHPDTVKNLVLHATPLDLEKPNTVIEKWTEKISPDKMVEKLGNIPGQLLNFSFAMRNPLENFLKYPNYFQKPRSVDEVKQFFAIETWLYDSRPISGKIYGEIIKKIYHQNQLIKNQMYVGNRKADLQNLKMPVLNIVGLSDDLVPPNSSKYVMCNIPSLDKELIEYPTGHVGLCISKGAHQELWPKVTDWIKNRS